MHVLVVNFNLEGINHDQFSEACDELADTFAAIPGLIAKVWLSDPDSNTYGEFILSKTKLLLRRIRRVKFLQQWRVTRTSSMSQRKISESLTGRHESPEG